VSRIPPPGIADLSTLDPNLKAGLREHVHRVLRQAILSGRYAAGTRLNERSLADQLGVSTTPVKEALRQLDAEGLVVTKPRRGVMVQFNYDWAEEMILARAAIESTISRLAAQRVTDDDKPKLHSIMEAMRATTAHGTPEELIVLNERFHSFITTVARASYLGQLSSRQQVYDGEARRIIHTDARERDSAFFDHHAIGTAVLRQDAAAAEHAMKAHVMRAGRSYLTLVFGRHL